jgi:hypothetical protein
MERQLDEKFDLYKKEIALSDKYLSEGSGSLVVNLAPSDKNENSQCRIY